MTSRIQAGQIRQRASTQSYSRGEAYYQNEAIFATLQRGPVIEGRCAGSSGTHYHVRATLDEHGNIVDTSCSCDYSFEGDCKHIVALLLTYANQPEEFDEVAANQDALAGRSQAELIALIQQMVARYPDLQALIERPIPRGQPKEIAVDLAPFQRELQAAIHEFERWGEQSPADTVSSIAETARSFIQAGRWRDGAAIYRTILDACTHGDEAMLGDEGELIWALNPVLEGVVECLEQEEIATDASERRLLIDHLLDAYVWDIDMGGQGLGDGILPDTLLDLIRPDEIPHVRERVVEARQRKARSEYGRWGVEVYESFLIALDALDSTNPEETLQRLREGGLYRLLFDKLMAMGRVDEAITVASQHLTNANERLLALPQLVSSGRGGEAVRLANESLRLDFNGRLAQWLAGYYQTNNDRNALFELRLLGMQQQPSLEYYIALKQVAESADRWEPLRPDLIAGLQQQKNFDLLIRIYLYEQEWDAAWETLEQMQRQARPTSWGWIATRGIELEVAEKSQQARPQKALPIFVAQARHLIDARSRDDYRRAAAYLVKVRALCEKMGDEGAWQQLIQGLRDEFRKLRALQDELTKAGL